MKIIALVSIVLPALSFAQAVYGPQGQYEGYTQTSLSVAKRDT